MKYIKISIFSFLLLIKLTFAFSNTIDLKLKQKLILNPDSAFSVLLILEDKADLHSLVNEFESKKYKRHIRHKLVIDKLKYKASNTQKALLEYLNIEKLNGRIFEVNSFWIDNIIAIKGKASSILLLETNANIPEPYRIITDFKVKLRSGISTGKVASPSGTQPNLKYINADKAWDMGIAGDGSLVCIFDDGVTLHNALVDNWRGSQQ